MTTGNTPAAAPPTADLAGTLSAFYATWTAHARATAAAAESQTAYVDAVNALPLPELMSGPAPLVTDKDPLERVEKVLRLSITGDNAEHEIGRRLAEVRAYRERAAMAAESIKPDHFGAAALDAMQKADAALKALLAVDDPADVILQTAWQDFLRAAQDQSVVADADERMAAADAVLFAAEPSTLPGVLVKLHRFLLLTSDEELMLAFAEGDGGAVSAYFERDESEPQVELVSVAARSLETLIAGGDHAA